MPIYSFGINSPLKIELTDDQAATYNRAIQAFFDAQDKLRDAGTPWEPEQPIYIEWTEDEMNAFNDVGQKINEISQSFGRPIHESELTDDFLIKN